MLHVDLDAPVKDFMRRTLYFLDPDDTCDKAARVMKDPDIGSVFVTENGTPVGIVTERDLVRKLLGEGRDPAEVKLSEIMSSPIVTVGPDAKVGEALEIMARNGFRRLLVMDGDRPVGIIAQRFTIKEEVDFLRNKAYEPAQAAMRYHPFYHGKVEINLKVPVRNLDDFAIWYTPGVAEPCKDIQRDPRRVYDHTNKGNTIAIVTDGTRVLGLGDIVETVKAIQPAYGGVNLEDIAQPKCFRILNRLIEEADIPVWHDDQQGTATVVLVGLMNALRVVGKKLDQVKVTLVGAGASNIRTARLLRVAGVDAKQL